MSSRDEQLKEISEQIQGYGMPNLASRFSDYMCFALGSSLAIIVWDDGEICVSDLYERRSIECKGIRGAVKCALEARDAALYKTIVGTS